MFAESSVRADPRPGPSAASFPGPGLTSEDRTAHPSAALPLLRALSTAPRQLDRYHPKPLLMEGETEAQGPSVNRAQQEGRTCVCVNTSVRACV